MFHKQPAEITNDVALNTAEAKQRMLAVVENAAVRAVKLTTCECVGEARYERLESGGWSVPVHSGIEDD